MAKKKNIEETTETTPIEETAPVEEAAPEAAEPEASAPEAVEPEAIEPELVEPHPVQTLPLDEAVALGLENLPRILEVAKTNGAPHRELICFAVKSEHGTVTDGMQFGYYITGFPDGTSGAELA